MRSLVSSPEQKKEFFLWWKLAWRSSLRSVADTLPWLTTLSLIGRVSTQALAALSLVETWLYGMLVVSAVGMSMSQSTLVSQAHGSKKVHAMRGWLFMSMLVNVALTFVTAVLWYFTEPILNYWGFDPVLTRVGSSYAIWAIPALLFDSFNTCISAYLFSIHITAMPLFLQLSASGIDVIVSYVCIFGLPNLSPPLPDSLQAAAMGWIAKSVFLFVSNVWLLRRTFGHELEKGHDEVEDLAEALGIEDSSKEEYKDLENILEREAKLSRGESVDDLLHDAAEPLLEGGAPLSSDFGEQPFEWHPIAQWLKNSRNWKTFLRQTLPNLVSVLMYSSQITVLSFLAADLGSVELAAHNTLLCFSEIVHALVNGMMEATSVCVGFHLGRGEPKAAKSTMAMATKVALLWGAFASVCGFLARNFIGRLFTADTEVVEQMAALAPYMWVGYALLCVGDQWLGVLEGQGRATAETLVYLAAAWVVGLPLAFCSVKLTDFGLQGIWASLFFSYAVLDVLAGACVWKSDWEALSTKAMRIARSNEKKANRKKTFSGLSPS